MLKNLSSSRVFKSSTKLFSAIVILLVTLLSVSVFHVLVSFDGHIYINLQEILFTERMYNEWIWFRTPLFPLTLRLGIYLFGDQPYALIFVNQLLGIFAVLVIVGAIAPYIGSIKTLILAIVITLFPTRIAYQQAVLTETGAFFFLACAWALMLNPPRNKYCGLTLGILFAVLGFYYRPALLSMAGAVALRFATYYTDSTQTFSKRLVTSIKIFLVVIGVSVALTISWYRQMRAENSYQRGILVGLVKQGLFPLDLIKDQDIRKSYKDLIDEYIDSANLKFDSIPQSKLLPIAQYIEASEVEKKLTEALSTLSRIDYIRAAFRTMLSFLGFSQHESKNQDYRNRIFVPQGSSVYKGPTSLDEQTRERYGRFYKQHYWGTFLTTIAPFFESLVFLGACATLILLATKWWYLSLLPLIYLASQTTFLIGIDRYAYPAQPLFLANLFMLIQLIFDKYEFMKIKAPKESAVSTES